MTNRLNIFGVIGQDITKDSTQKAIAAFENPNDVLEVYIDCDGGSVTEGMAIIDLLQAYPGITHSIVSSAALSMGSAIAVSCDKRSITRNGVMMIHEPRMLPTEGMTVEAMRNEAANLERFRNKLIAIYSESTGKPVAEITGMLQRGDCYFTAEEAFAAGIVHEIVSVTRPTTVALSANIPMKMVAWLKATETQEPPKMSITPTALKGKFPRLYALAKAATILAAMEKPDLTEEMAVEAMADDVAAENEMLRQRVAQLESELAALKTSSVLPQANAAPGAVAAAGAQAVVGSLTNPAQFSGVGARPANATTVPPISAAAGTQSTATPQAEWESKIDEFIAQGHERSKAVRLANKKYPQLREQVVAAANPGRQLSIQ